MKDILSRWRKEVLWSTCDNKAKGQATIVVTPKPSRPQYPGEVTTCHDVEEQTNRANHGHGHDKRLREAPRGSPRQLPFYPRRPLDLAKHPSRGPALQSVQQPRQV